MQTTSQTPKQEYIAVRELLKNHKGIEMDGIDAAQWIKSVYGITVGFHLCSSVLDGLCTVGFAKLTKPGGLEKYIISA